MGAAGGRWRRPGTRPPAGVRSGSSVTSGPARTRLPTRGRSLLGPALLAASASDRPLIVVTDGEIEDVREIPPDLLARSTIRVFPSDSSRRISRSPGSPGPARVSAGDSIAARGGGPAERWTQGRQRPRRAVLAGTSASGASRLCGFGEKREGGPGSSSLRRAVAPATSCSESRWCRPTDAEPRTDTRLHLVTVAATPGVVFLAAPGGLGQSIPLSNPARCGAAADPGLCAVRREPLALHGGPSPGPGDVVRRAARRADLLILKGGVARLRRRSHRPRASGAGPAAKAARPSCRVTGISPRPTRRRVAGAFLGQPVDSFPPAVPAHAHGNRRPRLGGTVRPARPAWPPAAGRVRPAGGPDPAGDRGRRRALALAISRRLERAKLPLLGGGNRRAGCSAESTRREA